MAAVLIMTWMTIIGGIHAKAYLYRQDIWELHDHLVNRDRTHLEAVLAEVAVPGAEQAQLVEDLEAHPEVLAEAVLAVALVVVPVVAEEQEDVKLSY